MAGWKAGYVAGSQQWILRATSGPAYGKAALMLLTNHGWKDMRTHTTLHCNYMGYNQYICSKWYGSFSFLVLSASTYYVSISKIHLHSSPNTSFLPLWWSFPLPFKSIMNPKVAIYGLDLLKNSVISHCILTNSSMISHQWPALWCVKLCVSCCKIPPIPLPLHPPLLPKLRFHRIHIVLR